MRESLQPSAAAAPPCSVSAATRFIGLLGNCLSLLKKALQKKEVEEAALSSSSFPSGKKIMPVRHMDGTAGTASQTLSTWWLKDAAKS